MVERLSTGRDNLVVAIISRELVCNVLFLLFFILTDAGQPGRASKSSEFGTVEH